MTGTGDVRSGSDEQDGARDRIPGGWIAITLAIIVLAGATLGIFQTDAGNNESNTARETTRTAAAALRAGVLASAATDLERDIAAQANAFSREQESVVRQAASAGGSAPALTVEELRGRTSAGADLPRARSAQQVRVLAFDAERLKLKQSALAETRVTWNDRSTQFTTAIAMLAVALFLVGFAVVLGGPRRTVFYVLGVGFAVLTLGWAGYIHNLSIPETSDAAIAATARGIVASGAGNQGRALTAFTEAVKADGDDAAPYPERAIARVLQANPDFRRTGAVTGGRSGLAGAIADSQRAIALGGSREFRTYAVLCLLRLYTGDYDAAVAAADAAVAINGAVPDVRLARSAAEAGRGDAAAARASLDGALGLLKGSDPSERTRGLSAQYLTYLEQVAHVSPARTPLVRSLEQEIINIETDFNLGRTVSGSPPARGSVSVRGLRYVDGELRLQLRWRDLPTGTTLAGIEFERPTRDGAWVQPRDLALFRTLSGSGDQMFAVPLTRACAPTELRVDLYLDGARTPPTTGPGGAPTC